MRLCKRPLNGAFGLSIFNYCVVKNWCIRIWNNLFRKAKWENENSAYWAVGGWATLLVDQQELVETVLLLPHVTKPFFSGFVSVIFLLLATAGSLLSIMNSTTTRGAPWRAPRSTWSIHWACFVRSPKLSHLQRKLRLFLSKINKLGRPEKSTFDGCRNRWQISLSLGKDRSNCQISQFPSQSGR